MAKDTLHSVGATRDLLARAKAIEFEFQLPLTEHSIEPVPVATLKLEPGQTLVLKGESLYVTVSTEQLYRLASQILKMVPKPSDV